MANYVEPTFNEGVFTCPHCSGLTQHDWYSLEGSHTETGDAIEVERLWLATCFGCKDDSIWYDKRMVFPFASTAPPPHPDLPDDLKDDYKEARDIVQRSPRGAAALMRLVLDGLVTELGGTGNNIFERIGNLVSQRKIDPRVQKALDSVRLVGNDSAHPGELNVKDTPEMANALFGLVNLVVQQAITTNKEIDAFYDSLPEGRRKAIQERDTPKEKK